jgi:hypothetical protein
LKRGALRPKHVLRDVDEGDAYVDEKVQIENFLETISAIRKVNDENREYRERIFPKPWSPMRPAGSGGVSCGATIKFSNCSRDGDWKAV